MSRLLALTRTAVQLEWRVHVGTTRWLLRRPDVPDGAVPVRYVDAVSALLWAITAVSTVELVALHLILPWPGVRLVADVLGVWGVLWCLGYTGCHHVYPHLVTEAGFRLRAHQPRPAVEVPWSAVVAAVPQERSLESAAAVQVDDGVVSVAVGKRTSLDLRLRPGVALDVEGVRREVREVRVYVDEAREVARVARTRMAGGATTPRGGGS